VEPSGVVRGQSKHLMGQEYKLLNWHIVPSF